MNRRDLLVAAGAALLDRPAIAQRQADGFPQDFRWGAATSGAQVEGNNVNSDLWLLEHTQPNTFPEPSGDADNSFELWASDLDLVRTLGLNTYRFSLEWARIEPGEGQFSIAMLDHYKAMIEGCRARGIAPVVTFCHYSTPRWFAAHGGWLHAGAPALFARFCERAMRHLGAGIDHAITLNEPNIMAVLDIVLPPEAAQGFAAMLDSAAKTLRTDRLAVVNAAKKEDLPTMFATLLAAHRAGREAIKAVRPDLPVGLSLSMFDDEAVGATTRRDAARERLYGMWLEAAQTDDFVGVQNYERVLWGADGRLPPPEDSVLNQSGGEVYAPSLANACRYAYSQAKVPIFVTEHGVSATDDRIRATLIREALPELVRAMREGVPVKGYLHWSLLDNWEFGGGYKPRMGLVAVNRTSFERTPKPSAAVLGAIARKNAL